MGKHNFFADMAVLHTALSFNDVRLRTGHSEIVPSATSLVTRFSRRIPLRIPIVSSPMDTITESKMAIAMAKAGGLGIIHRNLSPKDQAAEVARVKFDLNGMISRPICVSADETIRQILDFRREKGYSFHSFPVCSHDGKLVGILTKSDFEFCDNPDLPASVVMTRDFTIATPGTDLATADKMMRACKKKVLPLVDDSGVIQGMYVFSDVRRITTGNSEGFNTDSNGQLRVGAAIGTGTEELDRADLLVEEHVDVLVIDTAHGDTTRVIDMLRRLKEWYPDTDIVAGNVSEGDSARRLVDAGADGVRVGQGPGSICTTRIIAGVGCPQLTAVYQCARAIEGSNVPVCADGGISYSGDIPIAIGAGADTVMLGRLLAGTDEAPGEIIHIDGVPHKSYRGMGSLGAMQNNQSSRQRYGQRDTGKNQVVPEGVEGVVPYKGGVGALLHQYVEGLRRGMGYVGASTIPELQEKADFFRITSAGLAESHPHGVDHIQAAPNYQPGL